MDKITMLGTGHAMTMECFNTCFVYENDFGKLLVDTGGGQQLLKQLRDAKISMEEISAIFISHQHTDHLLGLPWIFRTLGGPMGRTLPLTIYMHKELMEIATGILNLMLPENMANLGDTVRFVTVADGDEAEILGNHVTFFDTHSKKCSQFGFTMTMGSGKRLAFCGDVPFHEDNRSLIEGAEYLMHEAFTLEDQPMGMPPMGGARMPGGPMPGGFGGKMPGGPGGPAMGGPGGPGGGPGGKMPGGPGAPGGPGGKMPGGPKAIEHSTVKGAAEIAESLKVGTVILFHAGDNDLPRRQSAYIAEAGTAFHGRVIAPYDLDIIVLE